LIDLTTFTTNLSGETGTFAASINDSDMNILAFIFEQAGWSGYFDNPADGAKFVFNAFVDNGNEVNANVAAVVGGDLLEVNEFGIDTDAVFTRVDVKGQSTGGSSILWQAKDDSIESDLWRKDRVVFDNSVTNRDEAVNRAGVELSVATLQLQEGIINMVGDARLRVGEYFRVSSPDSGLNGFFKAASIDILFGPTFTMVVEISRRYLRNPLNKLVAESVRIDNLSNFDNFNDMKFSVNFVFDDDSDITTSDSVEFADGRVKTTSGEGSFTSDIIALPNNVKSVDMRLEGPVNIADSRLFVSNDSGTTETEIAITDEDLLHTFSSTGSALRIRMILTGSTTTLDGLVVRVK